MKATSTKRMAEAQGGRVSYLWRKTASSKWADAWQERVCGAVGPERVVISSKSPRGNLLAIAAYNLSLREARLLEREFGGSFEPQTAIDWAAVTSKPRAPIRVRGILTISDQPPPISAEAKSAWLQIGASAAFGTGEHATTAMCLRLLADYGATGAHVLDAGCGSAILALAAVRLGAASALAIDNDPLAIRVAKQNARINRLLSKVRFLTGDVSANALGADRFDLIFANLFADALANLFPLFRRHLVPDGRLIYSGVLRAQESDVAKAACSAGFRLLETRRRGKWIAALCAASNESFEQ